jgi:hypothetical protein
VAKTQTGSQKPALTRGKAALIGVLSIVLVVVAYVQYGRYAGGSDQVPLAAATPRRTVRKPVRPPPAKPAETDVEVEDETQAALLAFDQTRWKPPELSKVVAYDPFALPPGFPQPSAPGSLGATEDGATAEEKSKQLADALAELRMQLYELKERGVHVIVGQRNEYVALIGDRKIHVGDEINGFTVTEIDPKHGVRVEMKRQ